MPNIYIETFGCQMNEADSQYVVGRAEAAGYAITASADEADVLVLNTCTVRDNAERRAYGRMNHFKALKDADPAVRDQLAAWQPGFSERVDFSDERALLMPLGGHADGVTDGFSHLRAYVNVQRGCSYYCTFCIVPHVRGRFDHRPQADVLADVREKIAGGAREVMLVGQTVNAWRDPAGGADFGDLCRAAGALDGLERLTFISPHPKDFSEKIIADLAAVPQLNPRVHLPLQSASDAMLRRMNRKYTLAQFRATVDMIHRYLPGCAITTDVIVGFPGETEADFRATLDYVGEGVFSNAFMFVYSPRRGTPAAHWEQVPKEIAMERFARLLDAQNAATRAYHDRAIGTSVRALICGESKKDASKLAAKTTGNVTVIAPKPDDYDQALYAREPWIDVRVEAAFVWGCSGTITGRALRHGDAPVEVRAPVLSLLGAGIG
jgi:tRNA-2-methylthio-N6-dimethylallyladenosine synthase